VEWVPKIVDHSRQSGVTGTNRLLEGVFETALMLGIGLCLLMRGLLPLQLAHERVDR